MICLTSKSYFGQTPLTCDYLNPCCGGEVGDSQGDVAGILRLLLQGQIN